VSLVSLVGADVGVVVHSVSISDEPDGRSNSIALNSWFEYDLCTTINSVCLGKSNTYLEAFSVYTQLHITDKKRKEELG
jgi:hypothetical protein